MKKTINAKAKTNFLPLFILWKIDQEVFYNKQPVKITNLSSENMFLKDFKVEKPKP